MRSRIGGRIRSRRRRLLSCRPGSGRNRRRLTSGRRSSGRALRWILRGRYRRTWRRTTFASNIARVGWDNVRKLSSGVAGATFETLKKLRKVRYWTMFMFETSTSNYVETGTHVARIRADRDPTKVSAGIVLGAAV